MTINTRLKKYIIETYGLDVYEEIREGKKVVSLNGKNVPNDDTFVNYRVYPETKVEVTAIYALGRTKTPTKVKVAPKPKVVLGQTVTREEIEAKKQKRIKATIVTDGIQKTKLIAEVKVPAVTRSAPSYVPVVPAILTPPEMACDETTLRSRLSESDVASIESGRATAFVDGLATPNLETFVPKSALVKVVPKFRSG